MSIEYDTIVNCDSPTSLKMKVHCRGYLVISPGYSSVEVVTYNGWFYGQTPGTHICATCHEQLIKEELDSTASDE